MEKTNINDIEIQIKKVLEKIRPFMQRDGGDVEFVSFENGIVKVKMLGACEGCALIDDTLQDGIANILKEEVPGIISVENV